MKSRSRLRPKPDKSDKSVKADKSVKLLDEPGKRSARPTKL